MLDTYSNLSDYMVDNLTAPIIYSVFDIYAI